MTNKAKYILNNTQGATGYKVKRHNYKQPVYKNYKNYRRAEPARLNDLPYFYEGWQLDNECFYGTQDPIYTSPLASWHLRIKMEG